MRNNTYECKRTLKLAGYFIILPFVIVFFSGCSLTDDLLNIDSSNFQLLEDDAEYSDTLYYSVRSEIKSDIFLANKHIKFGNRSLPSSGDDFINQNAEYCSEDDIWWISEETVCKYVRRGKKISWLDAEGNVITANASCEFLSNSSEDGQAFVKKTNSKGEIILNAGLYTLNTITGRTRSQMEEQIAVKERENSTDVIYSDEYLETSTTEPVTEISTEPATIPETQTEKETETQSTSAEESTEETETPSESPATTEPETSTKETESTSKEETSEKETEETEDSDDETQAEL